MWSVTFICVVASFANVPTMSQVNTTEVHPLRQSCSNGEQLAICWDIFLNATNFIPAGNREAFCKLRSDYSICLEEAVCTCKYTALDPLLENAYKGIMGNNYEFTNESCGSFKTDYLPAPGISCLSQNSSDNFKIIQNTADQPFITSLKQNCSALQMCFEKRDRNLEAAMFNKSLSAYCSAYDVFLQCFEAKVCECNRQLDQSMLLVNNVEKQAFTETCKIITGTHIVVSEIACGGTCSLSDPGVTCTQEFEKHISGSKGDEDVCRHLTTYAQCYERVVCQCGLFQKQNVYTAMAIIKHTFEVKSACGRFPHIVFPSNQSGFLCPENTQIQAKDKVLSLNTSQADYVIAEDQVCRGVAACYARFDSNGSLALSNKDLKAVCQAMNEEIKCLETTTCACGTLNTRFFSILKIQRAGMTAICGQDVIEISPALNCVDQSLCGTSYSLDNCTNILNRQAQHGEDAQKVLCENHVSYGQCIKDISCSCHLMNNGSSNATIEIYKLLSKNAAIHDSMGCFSKSNKSEHGLSCNGQVSEQESRRMLNMTWSLSSEKVQLVALCPAVAACFNQDDAINVEALFALDYKRVCRNQLNTLKCMEKAFCNCQLNETALNATGLSHKIIAHNTECSRYAPFGNKMTCKGEGVCSTAKMMDVCLRRLISTADSTAPCTEYTSYLLCIFDVACTCGLVKNGTEESAELVYRNVTKVLHLMQSKSCSFTRVPEALLQRGFECYDVTTALPVKMNMLRLSFAKGQQVQQWAKKCPRVVTCATQYDNTLAEALNVKNFVDVCGSTLNMTQCSQQALSKCSLTNTTMAVAFNTVLESKYSGCDAGNATETSTFGDGSMMMSANSSKLQVESVRGGYVTSTSSSSSAWKVTATLLLMTSLSSFRH